MIHNTKRKTRTERDTDTAWEAGGLDLRGPRTGCRAQGHKRRDSGAGDGVKRTGEGGGIGSEEETDACMHVSNET